MMRLTTKQITIIKQATAQIFSENVQIFLFGSRTDDAKKGGDIDLLIATTLDLDILKQAQLKNLLELQLNLPVDLLTLHYVILILMLVISILIFAFFAESGPHLNHGNLGWSYLIAQPIAYLFVIIDFVNNYFTITPFKKHVLNTILSLHLIGGVYYFIKIFMGLSYS